jgi:putative oxidoreductase
MLSILRIITSLLFLQHGLMKLVHFPAPQPGVPVPLPAMLVVAGLVEVVGGLLLSFGLLTRIAAFFCAGEMAIAYFVGHATKSFWPGINGGDSAILFCFVFLYLVAAGAGPWSVDHFRAANRNCAPEPHAHR